MMTSQFAKIPRKEGNIFRDNRVQALLLLKDRHAALAIVNDKKYRPTCTVRTYLQHTCFPLKCVRESSQGFQKDI